MKPEVNTDFSTKVLGDITSRAKAARDEVAKRQEEYYAAMKKLSIFKAHRNKALAKFESIKRRSLTGDESELRSAKANYNSINSVYSDSEINTDVLRSGLMDRIFFAGKMNNQVAIANAMLD